MKSHTLEAILTEHPFFLGCPGEHLALLTGCAANRRYAPGTMLCLEGDAADHFYIIREGHIAIECFVPGRGEVAIQTLGAGDVFGWSWIIPPYVYDFDARVLEHTRAIALDAKCLRQKCEEQPALGYELLRRFSSIMVERLRHTRVRLIDLYGNVT